MAEPAVNPTSAALAGFINLDSEFAAAVDRRRNIVHARRSSGNGSIDQSVSLTTRFRLVHVRCHFTGKAAQAVAPLHISIQSQSGSQFDTRLFSWQDAGPGNDVNFRLSNDELQEPSAWTVQAGDAVNITWDNPQPGSINWGLEVGLAAAT